MKRRWHAAIDAAGWLRFLVAAGRVPRLERDWSWERQARLEQVAAGARAAVVCLMAAALLLGWVPQDPQVWLAWGALAAFSVIDPLFRRRHAERPPRWAAGSALADLVLYADAVLATGGAGSPLLWLLAFGLVWQSHRLEPRASLPVTVGYVAVFVAIGGGAPSALLRGSAMLLMGVSLGISSARRADLHRRNLRDGLTGCFSRAYGMFALRQLVAGCAYPFSLLFLDLDYFKRVNDTLGHEFGDHVLAHAARAIIGAVRGGDLVVRYGGDEFLVLLTGADIEVAAKLAERVRERLRQATTAMLGDLPVTVSCGAVEARPGQHMDEILAQADQRLYEAKQRRDCIVGSGAVRGA